jgi:hypothetical protein
MTQNNSNPEFELLASAANFIRQEFEKEISAWTGSPLEWVLAIPSASKGKLGKRLVDQWCAIKGLSVGNSPDSEADMLINGHRVEIKFSTLWKAGFYKFQQIRDQDYEYAIFLGISPREAHCWVVSKAVLKKYVIGHMGQHRGAKARDTDWLTVIPDNAPVWLKSYGGTLEQAYAVLKSLSHKK